MESNKKQQRCLNLKSFCSDLSTTEGKKVWVFALLTHIKVEMYRTWMVFFFFFDLIWNSSFPPFLGERSTKHSKNVEEEENLKKWTLIVLNFTWKWTPDIHVWILALFKCKIKKILTIIYVYIYIYSSFATSVHHRFF